MTPETSRRSGDQATVVIGSFLDRVDGYGTGHALVVVDVREDKIKVMALPRLAKVVGTPSRAQELERSPTPTFDQLKRPLIRRRVPRSHEPVSDSRAAELVFVAKFASGRCAEHRDPSMTADKAIDLRRRISKAGDVDGVGPRGRRSADESRAG